MPIYPGRKPRVWRVTVDAKGKRHEEAFHGTRTEAKEHEARMRVVIGARGRQSQRIAPLFSDLAANYAPSRTCSSSRACSVIRTSASPSFTPTSCQGIWSARETL